MEVLQSQNGKSDINQGITKYQAGEKIFQLFEDTDSGDINLDINFGLKDINVCWHIIKLTLNKPKNEYYMVFRY